jgi:hypothetical protein
MSLSNGDSMNISDRDQPVRYTSEKRHRVWLNCSPFAKPKMVVGVTR